MIVIKITIQNSKYFSLNMVGHADYNPGNDIVCSAVSTLNQTFIHLISEMGYSDIISKDGLVEVKGKCKKGIKHYLKFIITGYSGLANAYPDNVRLEVIDKRKWFKYK